MIEVTTPALAAHPFLRGMPRGQVETLGAAVGEVSFGAGQRIFEAGGTPGGPGSFNPGTSRWTCPCRAKMP